MKRLIVALTLAAFAALPTYGQEQPAVTQDGIRVYFSPDGGCTSAIVEQINKAKSTMQIQAYSFTSPEIAKALLAAQKRGVRVVALLDASNRTSKYSAATFLRNAGAPVYIDAKHAIAHSKIMLIDNRTVITGSFNFTQRAEHANAENLLIIEGKPGVVVAYQRNFGEHLKHADKYVGPTQPDREVEEEQPGADFAPGAAPASQAASGGAAAVTSAQPGNEPVVHVTKSGKKYHKEGCELLAKSDVPMKLSQAKAKGYTSCSRCNPPK